MQTNNFYQLFTIGNTVVNNLTIATPKVTQNYNAGNGGIVLQFWFNATKVNNPLLVGHTSGTIAMVVNGTNNTFTLHVANTTNNFVNQPAHIAAVSAHLINLGFTQVLTPVQQLQAQVAALTAQLAAAKVLPVKPIVNANK